MLFPTYTTGKPIDIKVKAEQCYVAKISNGKVQFEQELPIDALINNAAVDADTKAPKDAAKQIVNGFFLIKSATTDQHGNTLISTSCAGNHQTIQLGKDGSVAANYFDATDQDWCVGSDLRKSDSGNLYWVRYDMPKHSNDASEEDRAKAFNQRTAVISSIDTQGRKLGKSLPLVPEGATLDAQAAVTPIGQNELLVLGNGRKKEIILTRIALK